jgi:hypothetical protein
MAKTDNQQAAQDGLLLDLDTFPERKRIRIDGENYEMLSPEELSLMQTSRISKLGKRLEELSSGDADASLLRDYREVLDGLVQSVLPDIGKGVLKRLSEPHKLDIVEVFTALLKGHGRRLSEAASIIDALTSKQISQDKTALMNGTSQTSLKVPSTGASL